MSGAATASEVRSLAAASRTLAALDRRIVACRACPRLVEWREHVAAEKRRAYAADDYWGRPITGWGAADPVILIVGLAPAAHGANRTGRVFTGDRSGDWLFAALHRVGLASKPWSLSVDDGQELAATRITAAVRCAPPANKPTIDERDSCSPWLDREIGLCRGSLKVLIALGSFAWDAVLASTSRVGFEVPRPRPRFGHGAVADLDGLILIGSYHPSQQNTFTGRLTEPMLDDVLMTAISRSGL